MSSNKLSLRDLCLDFVTKNNLLSIGDTVVVGVSGGADSVCLLNVLCSLKAELGISVFAVHVNHGIRGAEAKRDEDFVVKLCYELGVECRVFNVDCPSEAKITGESLEECGRRLRYLCFNSVCKNTSYKIATAHNANDNAETVLFNISRGSSLKGACGIPVKRDNIIRPLLFASRNSIEQYCAENDLSFVTDSTNNSNDYSRNKIRHEVLPSLSEVNEKAVESIFRFTQYVSEDVKYLDELSEVSLNGCRTGEHKYSVRKLCELPKPIFTRCVVKAVFDFCGKNIDGYKLRQITELIKTGGKCQLYKNCFLAVGNGELRLFDEEKKSEEIPEVQIISFEKEKYHFGDYDVFFEKCSKKVNEKLLDNLIDCDKIKGNLVLRTRQAGDDFLIPKRNVKKSLKKLFNELAIPVSKRSALPVIADAENVIWIYSVGVSKQYMPNENSKNIYSVKGVRL